jgi:single-strand DNA-binding protein
MTYEITGQVEYISETQFITETFKKREIVLKTVNQNNYEDFVKLEFKQDKCELLDRCAIGSEVTIKFSIGGRKYTTRTGDISYFTSLNAFYVSSQNQQGSQGHQAAPQQQNQVNQTSSFQSPPMPDFEVESEDGIPF